MASALNLNDFWEKIFTDENQDLEQKVYIVNDFASKIRKEFFKNNFMPFLKELMSLVGDIEKITVTSTINREGKLPKMIDVNDYITPEILQTAKDIFKKLLIEGTQRWNILVDSIEFIPKTNNGTVRIIMPNNTIGLYLSFSTLEEKRLIMLKDIGTENVSEWTWDIEWEYDIPKETIKYILKEKVNDLYH
jgi:hypothetical protein